jgi:hypothetical protein
VSNIFLALGDGTLDRLRPLFAAPFGFGGLTHPDRGTPIPSRLLLNEMVRLGCDFTFLRRSFHADVAQSSEGEVIAAIHGEVREATSRTAAESAKLREKLLVILPRMSVA